MTLEHEIVLPARVTASVEAGCDEQIDYTKELVRFASVRGAEHEIQDYVCRAFRCLVPAFAGAG
jgi:acetylornithine deacetylase